MTEPASGDRRPLPRPAQVIVTAIALFGIVVGAQSGFGALVAAPYAVVGAVLAIRRPSNIIGWILLAAGWSYALGTLTLDATASQLANGTATLATRILASAAGMLGGLPLFAMLFILMAVFPTGHVAPGRWARPARAAIGLVVAIVVVHAFAPTLNVGVPGSTVGADIPNPLAILPQIPIWGLLSDQNTFPVLAALLLVGVVSLLVRVRHARGVERQQLQWVVSALILVVVAVLGGFAVGQLLPEAGESGVVWIPVIVAFPMLPVAVGVAVLRYRLYEIDTLVNRTVVYGSVTAVLAVGFGAANVALQRVAESVTHQRSEMVAAALGVGATLAFAPLRRAVRPVVDRILPGRATLTLLFIDIVGSTAAIVELGDQQWRALLGRYRTVVRQELARFGGHEVNTAGDSFFATFDGPAAGLRCAWALRDGVRHLGLGTRIGVHLGECEMRGEEVSGLEVHTAARVMAAADDGEILVSSAVIDTMPGAAELVTDRGLRALKGVPGEWQLYALASPPQPPAG